MNNRRSRDVSRHVSCPALVTVSNRTAEEAAGGRRLIANVERRALHGPAAVFERMQSQIEDRAGEQRALHWVRRLAATKELLDVPRERIEEAGPRRRRQVKIKAHWLGLPFQPAGKAKVGDGFDQIKDRAAGAVGIFDED